MRQFMLVIGTVLVVLLYFGATFFWYGGRRNGLNEMQGITGIRWIDSSKGEHHSKNKYPEWISSYLSPEVKEYKDANLSTLYKIYHSFSDSVETLCPRRVRLGKLGDGGWDICDHGNYALRKPCLVYSFGISNDWSFDDAMEKYFGCEIHSFDPSIGKKDHNRSNLIHFHETGLSGKDSNGKWKMRTLTSIKKELGHEHKLIDVLKMDIESSEWDALPKSVDDSSLSTVKQLDIEFHIHNSQQSILRGIDVLLKLYNFGFKKFSSIKNIHNLSKVRAYKGSVTRCQEAAYLNMRFQGNKTEQYSLT